MSKAVRCPVCGGTGKIIDDGYTTSIGTKPCHGCGGSGLVTVQ